MEKMSSRPIKLFYCYAREDQALRKELEINLSGLKRQYHLINWSDREILPGNMWEQDINTHLNTADIILLLISPNFLASDYCYGKEMQRTLERHQAGTCRVIPILMRPTYWKEELFSNIQMLPTNTKPVTSWPNPDEAFADIAQGIHRVVNNLFLQLSIAPELPTMLSPQIPPKKAKRIFRFSLAFLVLLAVMGITTYSILAYTLRPIASNTFHSGSTSTLPLIPNKQPILDDSLDNKNTSPYWNTGTQGGGSGNVRCIFEGTSYHISAQAGSPGGGCNWQDPNISFTNFVYQIKMVINQGLNTQLRVGPDFCWNPTYRNGSVYEVTFNTQGNWYFDMLTEANVGIPEDISIQTGHSQSFRTGIGQTNYITIKMLNHHIDVQVNGKSLFSTVDSTLNGGQIGIALSPGTENANVSFNDAKVWQL